MALYHYGGSRPVARVVGRLEGAAKPAPESPPAAERTAARESRPTAESIHAVEPAQGSTGSMPALESRPTVEALPVMASAPHRGMADHRERVPVSAGSWAPLPAVIAEVRDRAQRAVVCGDLERAVLDYQRVTNLAPRDRVAADSFARVLATTGRSSEASAELLRLAALYADMGQRGESLRALKQALEVDPSSLVRERLAPLVLRLGPRSRPPCERAIEDHIEGGRLHHARDLLVLLLDAQPDATDLRYRLARLELMSGNTSVGLDHLRVVLKHHRRERNFARLVPVAEDLLRHGGPDRELLLELAIIYSKARLDARALDKLEQLHRLVPSDLEVLERVAMLQARQGRTHASMTSLWRLVRGRRGEGVEDGAVIELLRRARGWEHSRMHYEGVEALAYKVLPIHVAARIALPGWALSEEPTDRVVMPGHETPR